MACALVSPCGRVELLNDANLNFNDVLREPVHSLYIGSFGGTLFFSSAAFFSSEVNEFASGLANQLIKGDACLVHGQQQQLVQCLMQSKHLRIAQECSPCTPGSSLCTNSHSVLLPPAGPGTKSHSHWDSSSTNSSNSSIDAASCCDPSSSCFLKRPRSLQHIAAANSTRQRILRSMSAAGAGAPLWPAAAAPAAAADAVSLPPGGEGSTAAADAIAATATAPAAVCTSSSSGCPQYSSSHRRMPVTAAKGNPPTPCRNNSSSIPFYDSYSSSLGVLEPGTPKSRTEAAAVSGPLQQCSSTDTTTEAACDDAQPMDVDPTPQQQQQQQQSPDPSHLLQSMTAGAEEHQAASSAPPAAAEAAAAATTMQSGVVAHTEGEVHAAAALSELPDAPANSAAAAAAAVALPVWVDLPVEVIAQVARFTGDTVAAVMPICMTCRSWRQAVLEDDQLLLGLTFKLNAPPQRCSSRGHRARLQHPILLERASKLGNVSALVVRARLLDAAGAPDEAMRCWRRAAKAGHLEGQLVYGLALYRGTAGVAPDAEDAHLWLSKALKQVLAAKQPSSNAGSGSNGSSSGTGSGAQVAAEGCSSSGSPVPSNCMAAAAAASSRQLCGLQCRVLTQAGLVLGYLAFDGEGTRTDKQEAVRCFKLAAAAGCKEAQQVLGWIFNTGQY